MDVNDNTLTFINLLKDYAKQNNRDWNVETLEDEFINRKIQHFNKGLVDQNVLFKAISSYLATDKTPEASFSLLSRNLINGQLYANVGIQNLISLIKQLRSLERPEWSFKLLKTMGITITFHYINENFDVDQFFTLLLILIQDDESAFKTHFNFIFDTKKDGLSEARLNLADKLRDYAEAKGWKVGK